MDREARPDTDEDAVRATVRRRLHEAVVDLAPVFGFTLSFALTHHLFLALATALVVGLGVFAYRLLRREPVRRTLGSLGVVSVGALLASATGQATSFFVPGLLVHCTLALVTPVLLLLGWPPLGLVIGMITGERTLWRRCAVRRRALTLANLVLYTGSLTMLAIQLPLFLSGQAVALGTVDLFGPLVFGLSALVGWQVYRRALGVHRCSGTGSPALT
ncbi:hypothetical protein GCM10010174_34090 [Kutzneria viridogrisea]|uniref:DUF3159 domain-containing protein n=2 Tax=Kutzneria TaxID=43356 RepID=A0ABR6BM16_9PSEU|nr:DUF3159 domain-containing protein [Kutzneria albida]AHH96854.1 putative membrane protein [Kutzneria albida DSM 43870]MBA8927923.1 hypothetical protein [Kutzneria viridogrisea]